MKNRIGIILAFVLIFAIWHFPISTKPQNMSSEKETTTAEKQSFLAVYNSGKNDSSLSTGISIASKKKRSAVHIASMDELQQYLIQEYSDEFFQLEQRFLGKEYTPSILIELPEKHMNSLQDYIKTHNLSGGLAGVSIWHYNDTQIFVRDTGKVNIYFNNVDYSLSNDVNIGKPVYKSNIINGWILEDGTLSYYELGDQVANYNTLPDADILDFDVFYCDSDSSYLSISKTAILIATDQIIIANKNNCNIIQTPDLCSYYITNNGYVFYVDTNFQMYGINVGTCEVTQKASDAFCIVGSTGICDVSDHSIQYVNTNRQICSVDIFNF